MRFKKILSIGLVIALSFAVVGVAEASHGSSSYSSYSSNRISAPSNVRAVDDITAELPGQPVVGVRWNDNSSDEHGFIIMRSALDGRDNYWYEVGRVGKNVKKFHDRDVDRGVKYWYKVKVYKMKSGRMISATSGSSNSVTPHFQGQYRNR